MKAAFLSLHDYLVRLPRSDVDRLLLNHILTECVDESLTGVSAPADTRRGVTEWEGSIDNCLVSLAWDWKATHDGHLQVLPLPVRTNLMLLDEHGYDVGHDATSVALLRYLETSSWWHAPVAAARRVPQRA